MSDRDENKILRVGEELWRETLPLKGGSRLYQLQDLKPQTWYEVKISYPASVCILCLFSVLCGESFIWKLTYTN